MFTAVLFTIAKSWKQPIYPSVNERINKMGKKYYSPLKRNEIVTFYNTDDLINSN